jgi:hypothetical protein
VHYRIKVWNAEGLKALERHKPSGRPKRLPDHLGEQTSWHTKSKVGLQAALDALTEQVHMRFTLSFATASFILFLVGLAWLYAGKKWLAVIMDNAGGHISKAFRVWVRRWNCTAWAEELPRIVPVYLLVGNERPHIDFESTFLRRERIAIRYQV